MGVSVIHSIPSSHICTNTHSYPPYTHTYIHTHTKQHKNNALQLSNPSSILLLQTPSHLSCSGQEPAAAAVIAPPNRLLWIIHRCRPVARGYEAMVMIEDFLTRILKVCGVARNEKHAAITYKLISLSNQYIYQNEYTYHVNTLAPLL